jgi:hypothetical protein
MKRSILAILGLCLMLVQSEAYASTLSSVVQTVRVSPGASPVRMSILMVGSTSCPATGWFAFENAGSEVGMLWSDLAIAASKSGKALTIVGTGRCDTFGVEGVSFIDLH